MKDSNSNKLLLPIKILTLVAAVALWVRLTQIQIVMHNHYDQIAKKQHAEQIELLLPRGRMYDRNGVVLAMSVPRSYSYGAHPKNIKNPLALATALSDATGIEKGYYLRRLNSQSNFVWVARQLEGETAKKVHEIKGLIEEWETRRSYPFQYITPKAVGFTDRDGVGIAGLELIYNQDLKSIAGWADILMYPFTNLNHNSTSANIKPLPGANLVLTFDSVIQQIAVRELRLAVDKWDALNGMVIIMLPRTGEILALASTPDFNPNNPGAYPPEARREKNVVDMYEPGSMFKIVPLAAALKSGISPKHKVFCEYGEYQVGSLIINDSRKHGWLTLEDIIVYSSNIGVAKIDKMLGAERLFDNARSFGFGCPTGVEIPAEVNGMLPAAVDWDETLLATIGYGQGVAVSSIQLACAYSAIANDGILLKPQIVKAEIHPSGKIVNKKPVKIREVISKEKADIVTNILIQVVERGTGKTAKIEGVTIAGKTSTAQKPISKKLGYSEEKFISGFIGYTVEEPRVLCLVILDEPKGQHAGSVVAAPVFQSIMKQVILIVNARYRALAGPVKKQTPLEEEYCVLPNFLNMSRGQSLTLLKEIDTDYRFEGTGERIVGQFPYPGQVCSDKDTIVLYTDDPSAVKFDLEGLNVRQATKLLIAAGYTVKVKGEGLVETVSFAGKNCILYAKL